MNSLVDAFTPVLAAGPTLPFFGEIVALLAVSVGIAYLCYRVRIAAATGLTLAQIGEFSFVLNVAGRDAGLTPMGLGAMGEQVFIAATVLLMLLTPLLLQVSSRFGEAVERVRSKVGAPDAGSPSMMPDGGTGHEIDLEDHVIVVGYGPGERRLTTVLQQAGIPCVVVDLNPDNVRDAKAEGLPAIYGDATRPHVLEVAGVMRAKCCVVAINDREATLGAVRLAAYENPTLQIFARADFLDDVERLHRAGAEIVVPTELKTAVRLFAEVLRTFRLPADEVRAHIQEVRAHDYERLRAEADETPPLVLDGLDDDGVHTRTVVVRDDMPASEMTLGDLALPDTYGVTVLAVRRADRTIADPPPDTRLEPGDRLILLGSADCYVSCTDLFRPREAVPEMTAAAEASEATESKAEAPTS